MEFETGRMYRVKAVAEALDVSLATVYRAIDSGKLRALKLGAGNGTLRIPGDAINAYLDSCAGGGATAEAQHETENGAA